jgi:hypothetical protein
MKNTRLLLVDSKLAGAEFTKQQLMDAPKRFWYMHP